MEVDDWNVVTWNGVEWNGGCERRHKARLCVGFAIDAVPPRLPKAASQSGTQRNGTERNGAKWKSSAGTQRSSDGTERNVMER